MRVAPALLAATMLAACAAPGPTFTAEDEAAVRQNLDDYTALTMARDWDGIVALYAPEAVRFAPNEPPVPYAAMRGWLEAYPAITAFEAPTTTLDASGDLAVATGTFALTLTLPGVPEPINDNGKWFVVLKKQGDGTWKRTFDGWSSNNPAQASP